MGTLCLAVASIGAGLFTTISITSPTIAWAAFMVITGIGIGIVQQIPYTAVQAVLSLEDVATGNAIAVFSNQLGGAVALAIAQNLLTSKLQISIPQDVDSVTASEVLAVGVDGLASLTSSPTVLHPLRQAYSDSVRYTFILAVASVVFAFLPALVMENVNIKHIAAEREQVKKQDDEELNVGTMDPALLQAEEKETSVAVTEI
ncbi:hypothetical protein N0V93_002578 [Gnomoniopsis smithogilvyi]|uniref:Major facilitator superfamily (MFS) profile domain-containing protein n=1 Tax=Gnomoniopsis smithogilvyi TaxID=1191159 RepID=A0A9W9CXS9_9PEZI|nr:hypothetical protein N0V93_002578 [Gnomoniopsis smithogilvyi]